VTRPTEKLVVFDMKFMNRVVWAGLFSAAARCFPRARLQPPCPGNGYVDVVRTERLRSAAVSAVLRGAQTRAMPAGVTGPPPHTTIIIVKASYTVLLPNIKLSEEIHEDSLKKRFSFYETYL